MTTSTFKANSLLIALLSPFLSISQAQADSVDEWAYWNASPQFDPKGFQFVYNSNPTTAEQTRTGTNQGNLAESTDTTVLDWVGYSLGTYGSGSTYQSSVNKIGELALAPVNADGTANDSLKMQGKLGNVPVLLNLTGTGNADVELNFSASGAGSFNVSSADRTFNITEGGGTSNDRNGDFIQGTNFDLYSAPYDPEVSRDYLGGRVVVGLPMPISNISDAVAATRGDLIYSFSGRSALGSSIGIAVNFTQASWNGSFGPTSGGPAPYNGYTASGTIAGNTLTGNVSTSMKADLLISAFDYGPPKGDVISGQITGRLVGELANSGVGTAGIIGKSELIVQPAAFDWEPPSMGDLESGPFVIETLSRPELPPVLDPVPVNDIFMLGADVGAK